MMGNWIGGSHVVKLVECIDTKHVIAQRREQQCSVDVACPGEVIPANVRIVMLLLPANRM